MQTDNPIRTKKVRIRAGYFTIFAKNEYELDPNDGHISPVLKDDNSILGYQQVFKGISGYVQDVRVQSRPVEYNGTKKMSYFIDLYLNSGGQEVILEFNFDSGPGKSIATTLRRIGPWRQHIIHFAAWQMKPDEGQKHGRQGVSIYPNCTTAVQDHRLPSFYVSSKNIPQGVDPSQYAVIPPFEKQGRGGVMEYDAKAASDWLYDQFLQDVYDMFQHGEDAPLQGNTNSTPPPPPPPTQNNFYAQQPQQQQYAPPAQNYPPQQQPQYAQPTTGQPPVQNNYPPATNHAQPPQPPQQQHRPERTASPTPPSPTNYPMHEQIAPPTPPPPPARDYVQREPLNMPNTNQHVSQPGQVYSPNGGMSPNQNAGDSFDFPDDDLPF